MLRDIKILFLPYFSLCGGYPQTPRAVHISWTTNNSFQDTSIPEPRKDLPFSNNCSDASNKMYVNDNDGVMFV